MIEPFDLQTLFVNTFAGNVSIFIVVSLAAISGLAAMFRMKNIVFFPMVFLFLILISYLGWAIYGIAVITMAILIGYMIKRTKD